MLTLPRAPDEAACPRGCCSCQDEVTPCCECGSLQTTPISQLNMANKPSEISNISSDTLFRRQALITDELKERGWQVIKTLGYTPYSQSDKEAKMEISCLKTKQSNTTKDDFISIEAEFQQNFSPESVSFRMTCKAFDNLAGVKEDG